MTDGLEGLQQDALNVSVSVFYLRCILHPYEPCAATVAEKTIDRWKLAVAVHTHKVHISSFPVPLQKPC